MALVVGVVTSTARPEIGGLSVLRQDIVQRGVMTHSDAVSKIATAKGTRGKSRARGAADGIRIYIGEICKMVIEGEQLAMPVLEELEPEEATSAASPLENQAEPEQEHGTVSSIVEEAGAAAASTAEHAPVAQPHPSMVTPPLPALDDSEA